MIIIFNTNNNSFSILILLIFIFKFFFFFFFILGDFKFKVDLGFFYGGKVIDFMFIY